MKAVIRTAAVEDAKAIAAVHIASWQESYVGILPQAILNRISLTAGAEIRGETPTSPRAPYTYVAEDRGCIVGFIDGGPCRRSELGQQMEIYALYLLSRAKRQGIGGSLLTGIMKDFLIAGASSAGVWVLRDNTPARLFYEHFGATATTQKSERRGKYSLIEIGYAWSNLHLAFGKLLR